MAVRLWWLGLAKAYPSFTALLAFVVLRAVVMSMVKSPTSYGWVFVATEPVLWFLYMLTILEAYSRVLARYPGIQLFSRWVLTGALVLALAGAFVSLYPELSFYQDIQQKSPLLQLTFIAERGVLSGLVFLILMMGAFLVWFPVALPRNVAVHSLVFSAYFLSKAFVLLVRNLSGRQVDRATSTAALTLGCVCLTAWILRLKPEGERETVVVGHRWNLTEENRLIGQLKSVNAALSRAARE
ncbi:MAG: hypothetical protein HY235_28640 [Acidobacteria bacterium]|nr:hypothetical protein [Acidobacteriota bacterium]